MIRQTQTTDDLITVADFFQLVPDGQKADLIDGVIHMASPDSFLSSDLNAFLAFLMRGYVSARKIGGKVIGNRFACILNEYRAPEPDVLYIGPARMHLVEPNALRGGPDIAVEIVARESRSRDYHEKRKLYLEAGVTEYWIIDPLANRVAFLRLESNDYVSVPLEENSIFRSQALPGFWLKAEWLFSNPLPDDQECLRAILGA